MVYRSINEDKVSLLGFGLLRPPKVDSNIDHDELQRMVDYAIENGVNYFETAFMYNYGRSEVALGHVLKKHDRSKLYISTKLHMPNVRSKEEISEAIETQLKRLNTDYIDNYLLHNVNRFSWSYFKESGMYGFLCDLRKDGIVRNIGFSFHDSPGLLKEVTKEYKWDFAQLQINYLDWSVQRAQEQYEICTEDGLPVVVMEPVRGGELARLPESVSNKFDDLSTGIKKTSASYAIRWAASNPNVACVLSGMSTIEHVKDNVETFTNFTPITLSEQNVIDEVVKDYLSMGLIPCTACGYCVYECPKEIVIPYIFSCINEFTRTNDVKNFTFKKNVGPEQTRAEACIKCGKCLPHCPQKIDIPTVLGKDYLSVERGAQ